MMENEYVCSVIHDGIHYQGFLGINVFSVMGLNPLIHTVIQYAQNPFYFMKMLGTMNSAFLHL